MPRNYKRKSKRGENYSAADLATAIQDVQAKRLTVYRAAKVHNVPYNTLNDRVKGRRGKISTNMGRPTAIPLSVEQEIAVGLHEMEKNGLGLSRKNVLALVAEYINANGIETRFQDGHPQNDWWLSFKKRHGLNIKKPQGVEVARVKAVDPFSINEHFDRVSANITALGLEDKPHLIFNLDETGFCRDPSKTKIVGKIGYPATRTISSPGRDNVTVLVGASADGGKLPPLIIFKGKNVWDNWLPSQEEIYPGASFAATKNGWIDTSSFEAYFTKTLIPSLKNERPALVICDSHKSHVSLQLRKLAREEGITILVLPAHTSHILQPLDLSVMKSLKNAWDEKLEKWQRRHFGQTLKKKMFVRLLSEIWTDLRPDVIKSGFAKGGIFPFNRDVISEDMYDPAALRRYKDAHPQVNGSLAAVSSNSHSSTPLPESNQDFEAVAELQPSLAYDFPLDLDGSSGNDGILTVQPIPSTSALEKKTFQELLLETIKGQRPEETNQKKRRVASGNVGVITSDEYFNQLVQQQAEKQEQERLKAARKIEREMKRKQPKLLKKPAKKKKARRRPVKKASEDVSSSDTEAEMSIRDSDSDLDFEEYRARIMEEAAEDENEEELNDSNEVPILQNMTEDNEEGGKGKNIDMHALDWILVQFLGKKSVKHFVGQIQRFENGEPIVKYVKKLGVSTENPTFHFPDKVDQSSVAKDDVVCSLPLPEIGRRGAMQFNFDFKSFNLQ